jgi:hypothetical protein
MQNGVHQAMNARAPLRTTLAAALLAMLLLGGCAWLRGQPPASEIAHATGDALLLRVYSSGGFVPADYQLTNLPAFTLLGDGRVITTAPQDLTYLGPALPNLLVRHLSESGIQTVLHRAIDSGQLEADTRWRGAGSHVADAPDTVFILDADGRDVTVRVYALGLIGLGGGGFLEMSSEEQRAHVALSALQADLLDLEAWIPATGWADPEWAPYRADALRLVVSNADGEQPSANDPPLQVAAWPTPSLDPATFGEAAWGEQGRCGVVSGADATAWYEALGEANLRTRWVAGAHRFRVAVRPLMPDEDADCLPLR